eukprot:s284_g15.t1
MVTYGSRDHATKHIEEIQTEDPPAPSPRLVPARFSWNEWAPEADDLFSPAESRLCSVMVGGILEVMVDRFDPNLLRFDLLRRVAQSQAQRQTRPSCFARCAEELQLWFQDTWLGGFLCGAPSPESGNDGADTVGAGTSTGAPSAPSAPSDGPEESADSPGLPPPPNPSTSSTPPRRSFPAKALQKYTLEGWQQLRQDLKVLLFLSFPADSPFRDATVEGLFQWHHTRRSWVCWDWSSCATALMLCWDLAMNPLYRVPLVLFFYAAFGIGILMRKLLTFTSPSAPTSWRMCAFFFGRCVICQPLLVSLSRSDAVPNAPNAGLQAVQVEAFSSVIGLGMTNLSMVFMQQMQTLDTLLFCFMNGAVFILWIIFVLQMPLTDALHTAYVGSIVITAVCVLQAILSLEMKIPALEVAMTTEDLERKSFDHQLINTRGLLVGSSEQLRRQSTEVEFGFQMTLLERSRAVTGQMQVNT